MDEGPVCGLGGVDHNLTYNYSSSEVTQNLTGGNMVNFLCIPGKSERVVLDSNRAKVAAVGGELDEEVGNSTPKTRDHSAGWFSLFKDFIIGTFEPERKAFP